MRVGALTVDPVYDGYGDQVARDILQVPGKPDAWDKCGQYVDDAGNLQLICGGYLLRSGDRVVLIEDTRELQCKAPNLVALRTKATADPAQVTSEHAVQFLALIDALVYAIATQRERSIAGQSPLY